MSTPVFLLPMMMHLPFSLITFDVFEQSAWRSSAERGTNVQRYNWEKSFLDQKKKNGRIWLLQAGMLVIYPYTMLGS